MLKPLALAAFSLTFALPAFAVPGCDAFLDKLRAETGDLGVEFSHALVVTRARSDTNVFDITTKSEVDGALTCRGDALVRFEAHVSEPAGARALSAFDKIQVGSVRAALGWDGARSRATLKDMATEAKAYLDASRERGDVVVAGKTEAHAPGGVSLGLIYSEVDRAFIIVTGDN